MMLVVDCCVRGDASSTRQYYEAYLRKNGYTEENVTVLKLAEQDIAPLMIADLEKRDALRYAGKYATLVNMTMPCLIWRDSSVMRMKSLWRRHFGISHFHRS